MSKKRFTTTDIPDDILEEAVILIFSGYVRAEDFESSSRLVARGIMLERDAWLVACDHASIEARFRQTADDADTSIVN